MYLQGFRTLGSNGYVKLTTLVYLEYTKGRTSIEYFTEETPDIREYLEFGFYDWVTFSTNAGVGESMVGRWLAVSHKVG